VVSGQGHGGSRRGMGVGWRLQARCCRLCKEAPCCCVLVASSSLALETVCSVSLRQWMMLDSCCAVPPGVGHGRTQQWSA
jgi:hypothetical protein